MWWQLPESRVDVVASLAGTASERGREMLKQVKDKQYLWWTISRGLIGDDSEEAWEIRNYLKFDERSKRLRGGRWASFLKGLGLHKSD